MPVRTALETLEPRRLFATFTVTNINDAGAGSLRQAMISANTDATADTINFNIPGGGVQTIALASVLPSMTTPISVNATTQPGWSIAAPKIQIDGRFLSGFTVGFDINASNCSVYGTSLMGFTNGVAVFGSNNTVAGNFIGMRADGVTRESGIYGVTVQSGSGNQVGNAAVGGNLIAFGTTAATGFGISIGNTTSSSITSNLIGTRIDAATANGSRGEGIFVFGTVTGTIGGVGNAVNTVSGITGNGISIDGSGVSLVLQGNTIGLNFDRTVPLGNTGHGVVVALGSVTIAGGNFIASNGLDGVSVLNSAVVSIFENAISNNGGLGIDLGNDGVTPNDPLDADTGPNNLQNYPVDLTPRILPGGSVRVRGRLNTTANSSLAVDIYRSPSADPTGFGEGSGELGVLFGFSSGTGDYTFDATYSVVPPGSFFSATAETLDRTSEFSRSVKAFRPGDMDGNGTINNNDIAPFVQALTNPTSYSAAFPGIPIGPYGAGDINDDGSFNNNDIAPFVALLTAGRPTPVLARPLATPFGVAHVVSRIWTDDPAAESRFDL